MQAAQEIPPSITPPSSSLDTESSLILRGVSWATYESLLSDFRNNNAVHFAYDQGVLEIMAPSAKHEEPNRTFSLVVDLITGELDIEVRRLGSTTFTRKDLSKGFEPDSCFYIQNVERVHEKEEIDLTVDPPPDLVIEIDLTSSSLNKLPIYAAVKVPEVWRYQGGRVRIFRRDDEHYTEVARSVVLPSLTSAFLTQLLEESRTMRSPAWLRRVQAWARTQKP